MNYRHKPQWVLLVCACLFVSAGWASDLDDISARLSGTTITTAQPDATIRFYTTFLGFRELRRRELSAGASREVFGLADDVDAIYATLVPLEWAKDKIYLSSLNIVGAPTLEASPDLRADRGPSSGEITLAYRINGLDQIAARAEAKSVPVATPLKLSATGKSRTLTLLDPNGIRVHLYEYLDGKE